MLFTTKLFVNSLLAMDSQQEITTYYNSLAENYDSNRFENTYGEYIHAQEEKFLNRHWHFTNHKTLDIACGTGRWTHLTNYGSDISPNMIEVAKQKHPNKSFSVTSANQLPYEGKSFDACLSFHFIMHLNESELKKIVNEVARITKKGGVFIFDFPSKKRRNLFNKKREGWHASYSLTINELKKMISDNWELKSYQGVLFFPIHRIPKSLRRYFSFIDTLLCKSWLKSYASYLIVKIEKKV